MTRLRESRALMLRDAESFHEAATTLEQIGQTLSGEIRSGLGHYKSELLELASATGSQEHGETARLFEIVREARNMAVHDGAWARHLGSRLIDLLVILEEAIMAEMIHVQDIMVRNPVEAQPWHMLAQIRRTMLANSFSYLPILLNGGWHMVSDTMVMRYLRDAADAADRKVRLSTQIEKAVHLGKITPARATCCLPQDTLRQLLGMIGEHPVLVTQDIDGTSRLLGILTPFDLL